MKINPKIAVKGGINIGNMFKEEVIINLIEGIVIILKVYNIPENPTYPV